MRNFFKLCSGLNVLPLAQALARQPELWNQNTLRTKHPGTPHSDVDDIWLRFQNAAYVRQAEEVATRMQALVDEGMKPDEAFTKARGEKKSLGVLDENESINYPAFALLPQARAIVFDLMRLVEGERLGRVLITRLAPGRRIAPHVDGGAHAAYYDRYHVAIQAMPGALFRSGAETVSMQTGDVWWFDNSKEHEIVNNSADDRITMIVDVKTQHGGGASQ